VGTHAGLSWPEEAREVLKFQIRKRSDRQIEIQPQFTQIGDKIIGSTQWLGADGRRRERFQVLTVRDGKIVDMQGCTSRRQAERFARRATRGRSQSGASS
jgi:hypothetical protein